MLCNGEWLFELDHDDWLISTCLEDVFSRTDSGHIQLMSEIKKMNHQDNMVYR